MIAQESLFDFLGANRCPDSDYATRTAVSSDRQVEPKLAEALALTEEKDLLDSGRAGQGLSNRPPIHPIDIADL